MRTKWGFYVHALPDCSLFCVGNGLVFRFQWFIDYVHNGLKRGFHYPIYLYVKEIKYTENVSPLFKIIKGEKRIS